jgi:hypothetical protein
MKMRSWWALSLRRSRRISTSSSLRPAVESSSRIYVVLLAVVLSERFLRASPADKQIIRNSKRDICTLLASQIDSELASELASLERFH